MFIYCVYLKWIQIWLGCSDSWRDSDLTFSNKNRMNKWYKQIPFSIVLDKGNFSMFLCCNNYSSNMFYFKNREFVTMHEFINFIHQFPLGAIFLTAGLYLVNRYFNYATLDSIIHLFKFLLGGISVTEHSAQVFISSNNVSSTQTQLTSVPFPSSGDLVVPLLGKQMKWSP